MNNSDNWKKLCLEVTRVGFENASSLARLVYSCEVGDINQHASPDLYAIMDSLSEKDARIAELEERNANLIKSNVEVMKLNTDFIQAQSDYEALFWEMQNNPKFGLSEYAQERIEKALKEANQKAETK